LWLYNSKNSANHRWQWTMFQCKRDRSNFSIANWPMWTFKKSSNHLCVPNNSLTPAHSATDTHVVSLTIIQAPVTAWFGEFFTSHLCMDHRIHIRTGVISPYKEVKIDSRWSQKLTTGEVWPWEQNSCQGDNPWTTYDRTLSASIVARNNVENCAACRPAYKDLNPIRFLAVWVPTDEARSWYTDRTRV